MHFHIVQYYAKDLGNISTMKADGMFGLMKIDTLIINPFEKDLPLLSYDRVHALFKDSVYCELIETRIEDDKIPECITKLKELKGKHDIKVKANWYDDILYEESLYKKVLCLNNKYLDDTFNKFFNAYLKWSIQARVCDRHLKKAKAKEYTDNLLKNGGPSTDMFIKEKGREYTEKLFKEVLFGTEK